MLFRRLLLLVPLLPLLLVALYTSPLFAQLVQFPTATLTILTANGPHKFTIELASTPAQMTQGLMFRKSLAPDAGMLFDYQAPSMAAPLPGSRSDRATGSSSRSSATRRIELTLQAPVANDDS